MGVLLSYPTHIGPYGHVKAVQRVQALLGQAQDTRRNGPERTVVGRPLVEAEEIDVADKTNIEIFAAIKKQKIKEKGTRIRSFSKQHFDDKNFEITAGENGCHHTARN